MFYGRVFLIYAFVGYLLVRYIRKGGTLVKLTRHIGRTKQNLYLDCYNGFRNFKNPEKEIKLVEQSKAWVLSPERKTSKKEIEYVAKQLDA